MKMRDFLLTTLFLITCCLEFASCCGRRCPPRDRTPPTIKCPNDRHEIADPFQINVKVSWDEKAIVANDNRDGPITPTRTGKAPGKLFSEGETTIKYHARDKSGNTASCSFRIFVDVLRCQKWGDVNDGWKICHVSHDTRLGSICRFGCYSGHELVGQSRTECLETKKWDTATQPYCQKIQCDELLPTAGQYGIVDISCTDDSYYRSICSYSCAPGFSVLPGHSKVRVCTQSGSWRGLTPICVDTEPPKFDDCPYVQVGYAERSKTSGRIWWNQPLAIDNSGSVTTVQVAGPTSGSELDVGEHLVIYMAYDTANNTAFCETRVIVKQIKCHIIYPLPYTYALCPNGRIFGSSCEFMCDNGTTLNGPAHAQCDKTGEIVPYGAWSFSNSQPYCENQNTCPALRPPDNGALACDTWLHGRYCQMLCEEGYMVQDDPGTTENEMQIHKTLLVCGNSGTWYSSGNIPNCQEVTASLWILLNVDMQYFYEGDCESAKEEIKEKFIAVFTQSTGLTCQAPACTVSAVQVTCGASTGASDRKRREDDDSSVSFEVTLTLSENLTSTEIVQTRGSIKTALNTASENGDLDLEINGNSTGPSGISVSQPEGGCSEGSAYVQRTFQCVKCNPGYYHDKANEVCAPCPRGHYQDESEQTSCKACPNETTTESKGAYSSSQCIEACPAGYNSTTGTYPCSACDLGYYSENYGSIDCTSCNGSKITLKPGTASSSECRDFDVTYNTLNDTEVLTPATINIEAGPMNAFTLTFFVKCEQCENIVNIADTDGQTVLSVTNTDQLRIEFNGQQYDTGANITEAELWTQITVKNTGTEFIAYSDERELIREQLSTRKRRAVATLNVTIGGEGFIGSVSQMNMWSDANASIPVATDTCFNTGQGDLISWRQVSELDGSFVLTNSKCDVDDNCESSPCQNNGTCTDAIDSFSCACAVGFTGTVCETNIDDCNDSPCDNDATCVDGVDGFTCSCPAGYTGDLCETFYVDGGWTAWETSSECSVTCGTGVQQLARVCENPVPINGGKHCEGDNTTFEACETNVTCVNECVNEPTKIENGSMNCEWTDNETRVCNPTCNEGFDFDSDMYVDTSGIFCGPETGYTWNINNTDNPYSQLPACTKKIKALVNKVNFTATYDEALTTLNSEVESQITGTVNDMVSGTGCVSTGDCSMQGIFVLPSESQAVNFTIQLTCVITGDMDQCYDLLSDLVTTLNSYIESQEFTIQYLGNSYDVITNSSSLSGISECEPGHVPVWQYCVACGKGTYSTSGFCENCPYGSYQDEEGKLSCKKCPEGWTTAGLMTRDMEHCNVVDKSGFDITSWLLYGSIGVGCLILSVIAAYVICKIRPGNSKTASTAVGPPALGNRDQMANANKRFLRPSPTGDGISMFEMGATGKSLEVYDIPSPTGDGISMSEMGATGISLEVYDNTMYDQHDFGVTNKSKEQPVAYDNHAYESTKPSLDHPRSSAPHLPPLPPPRYESPFNAKQAW